MGADLAIGIAPSGVVKRIDGIYRKTGIQNEMEPPKSDFCLHLEMVSSRFRLSLAIPTAINGD